MLTPDAVRGKACKAETTLARSVNSGKEDNTMKNEVYRIDSKGSVRIALTGLYMMRTRFPELTLPGYYRVGLNRPLLVVVLSRWAQIIAPLHDHVVVL